MITTTLQRIRAAQPCTEGWEKLLKHLGKTKADDERLSFSVILESNGIDDALWCCRAEPQYGREWRLFAVWCARSVQRLMTDQRSIAAVDVAERYACGLATDDDLDAAWYAARYVARAAAWAAAQDAAQDAARDAAWAAAQDAAWAAARDAARAAARDAALDAAWDAAWAAARDAARAAQADEFLRLVTETEDRPCI